METDTDGRFLLTGNVFEDWPFAIGSKDTLAGKIPANTLTLVFVMDTLLPTVAGRARLRGRNDVLPPDDRFGCVGTDGFRGEGPTGG